MDNKAVTECATKPPHKECSKMEMCLKVYTNTSHKGVAPEWIHRHRDESEATSDVEREHVRPNNEADPFAKMATQLPKPDHDCRSLRM